MRGRCCGDNPAFEDDVITPSLLHKVAVAAYLSLFALLMAWLLWLDPPDPALRSIALVTLVGPLLIPLRGVLYGRRYTMAWSTIVILIYFIHGVTSVAIPGTGRWLGIVEIALATLYFTAAVSYVRLSVHPVHRAPHG